MTSELQQNRYDQTIRRVGGIIGAGSKVSEALSELFPVLDVENVPPELLLLGGTIIAHGSLAQSGTAAVQLRAQVFNPVDSGNLITVTSCGVSSSTAQLLNFGLVNTTLSIQNAVQRPLDGRVDLGNPVLGEIRFGTNAAVAPATGNVTVRALETFQLLSDGDAAVLPPGIGFQVTTTVLNTQLVAHFIWRERPAEPSELNL